MTKLTTAMILAAGRGSRLRPLTDSTPKPLLTVGDKTLIDHQIDRLLLAGFERFVINLGYLGNQLRAHLTARYPEEAIVFSREPEDALETGGGIKQALPLLDSDAFAVINADVWTDFDFKRLISAQLSASTLAHLILVPNPSHNPDGDFQLSDDRIVKTGGTKYTFSGISILRPELFKHTDQPRFPLAPLLHAAVAEKAVSGELYRGRWFDIGTKQRLTEIHNFMVSLNPTSGVE